MNKNAALQLLGLSGNPSEEEIKKAYRRKAMQFHPDKNKGDKKSEEKFKEISEAYQILLNPNSSKHDFDFSSFYSKGFGDDSVFESFINKMFNASFANESYIREKNRPGSYPQRLPDLNIGNFKISLSQAIFRESITIKLEIQAICPICCGKQGMWKPCNKCNKCGIIEQNMRSPQGFVISRKYDCPVCKGQGWLRTKTCSVCKNSIVYKKTKEIEFKLPKNFQLGQRVCIRGEGNESWKAPNGNIFVTPKVDIPDLSLLSREDKRKLKELLSKQ